LGRKRRLVLILEWDTLWPPMGVFPVTWHTLAMFTRFWEGKG